MWRPAQIAMNSHLGSNLLPWDLTHLIERGINRKDQAFTTSEKSESFESANGYWLKWVNISEKGKVLSGLLNIGESYKEKE